ncbi:MAG: hypothetical protein GYA51_02085 [Candidatus Methanofastidiosa archaeon]|nr:hypothetical protein [Candidatus Methanofastidiosa archaeon]
MLSNIAVIAVLILILTTTVLLLINQWRWMSIALAFQVFSVFWLTTLSWSIPESIVKLIGGWITIAITSSTHPDVTLETDNISAGFGFRFLIAGMIWLFSFSISPIIQTLIQTRIEVIWGGMLLFASGLLQVGLAKNHIRTIVGLITFISGFEVMYASIESSVLVSGLLVFITIGLSWLTIYFNTAPGDREEI